MADNKTHLNLQKQSNKNRQKNLWNRNEIMFKRLRSSIFNEIMEITIGKIEEKIERICRFDRLFRNR